MHRVLNKYKVIRKTVVTTTDYFFAESEEAVRDVINNKMSVMGEISNAGLANIHSNVQYEEDEEQILFEERVV